MRYWFPQYYKGGARFYTYHVVATALRKAGHEISPVLDGCDAALASLCDVTEYRELVRIKRSTSLPVIVGGHYAFNYWSAIQYADAVWIGEVFDFADCADLASVWAHPACYTGDPGKQLIASTRIDWAAVPVGQIAPRKAYYWGSVGCRNKCRFCFTSWTHRHECNSQARVRKACQVAAGRGLHLMVVGNEFDGDQAGGRTRDMLLVDYIRESVDATMIRVGIEFATEETRARMGKPITEDQLYAAIQKMNRDRISMRWFHITGYEALEDYERYIDTLCVMLARHPNRAILHLMFNNLQYQNYTPLYRERMSVDPSRYIDRTVTKRWYDRLRQYTSSVLVGAPSPFQHVACRMGVELAQTKEQIDYWLHMSKDPAHRLTLDQAHRALHSSGVLTCPQRRINPLTGAITVEPER